MGDLKAALWGTEYKKKQSKDLITDVPDGFKEWVAENMDAQANLSENPLFKELAPDLYEAMRNLIKIHMAKIK